MGRNKRSYYLREKERGHYEKQDRIVKDLLKGRPKIKPPRYDVRKHLIKDEDKDLKKDKEEKQEDLKQDVRIKKRRKKKMEKKVSDLYQEAKAWHPDLELGDEEFIRDVLRSLLAEAEQRRAFLQGQFDLYIDVIANFIKSKSDLAMVERSRLRYYMDISNRAVWIGVHIWVHYEGADIPMGLYLCLQIFEDYLEQDLCLLHAGKIAGGVEGERFTYPSLSEKHKNRVEPERPIDWEKRIDWLNKLDVKEEVETLSRSILILPKNNAEILRIVDELLTRLGDKRFRWSFFEKGGEVEPSEGWAWYVKKEVKKLRWPERIRSTIEKYFEELEKEPVVTYKAIQILEDAYKTVDFKAEQSKPESYDREQWESMRDFIREKIGKLSEKIRRY